MVGVTVSLPSDTSVFLDESPQCLGIRHGMLLQSKRCRVTLPNSSAGKSLKFRPFGGRPREFPERENTVSPSEANDNRRRCKRVAEAACRATVEAGHPHGTVAKIEISLAWLPPQHSQRSPRLRVSTRPGVAVANHCRRAAGFAGSAKPQLGESADARRAGARRSRGEPPPPPPKQAGPPVLKRRPRGLDVRCLLVEPALLRRDRQATELLGCSRG
jgi:hypothetical protein